MSVSLPQSETLLEFFQEVRIQQPSRMSRNQLAPARLGS
jgi:hypothetical protein